MTQKFYHLTSYMMKSTFRGFKDKQQSDHNVFTKEIVVTFVLLFFLLVIYRALIGNIGGTQR